MHGDVYDNTQAYPHFLIVVKPRNAADLVQEMIGKSIRLGSVHFSTADRKEYLYVSEIDRDAQRRYVLSWKAATNEGVLSKACFQVEAVPGHDDQIRLVSVHFSTAARKEYLYVASKNHSVQRRYIVSLTTAAPGHVLSKARFQVECLE